MDPRFAIAGRALGETLPISVSTAVALEGLPEKKKDWGSELWINVRTLLRNFWSTINTDDRRYVGPEHLYAPFLQEMQNVADAVRDITGGSMAVVYYHCDYSDLLRWLPNATLKEPSDLQKTYLSIEYNLFQVLLKEEPELIKHRFKTEISGNPNKCLMITHYPVDLLFAKSFGRLSLLESHTGAIKGRSEWNTKLTGGKLLTNIPFNHFSLQIFGDNSNLITAMSPKIRKVVLELAEKHRWTTVTTIDLIRHSIQSMKDPFARDFLMKVLKA